MKKLFTILLFLVGYSEALAQNEVFRIDSIPKAGILLDNGWKWHPGDNPAWARPDFDDSGWGNIDPTRDIDDLPQIKNTTIGWLRIRVRVDSSLKHTILSLQTNQVVAAEFYQNGIFIGNFGTVSANPAEVRTFFSFEHYKPVIHLCTGEPSEQVLAIRFSYVKSVTYQKSNAHKMLGLAIRLKRSDPDSPVIRDAFHRNNYEQRGNFDVSSLDYFKAGLFFILSILHLCFYQAYRFQKANLFFGLGCCFLFVFFLYQAIATKYLYHSPYVLIFVNLYWFIRYPAYLFLLTAVYLIFFIPKRFIYNSLVWGVVFFLGIQFLNLDIAVFKDTDVKSMISTIIFLDVFRVSWVAFKQRKERAVIILVGSVSFIIFTIASVSSLKSAFLLHLFTNIGTLSIPVSITLYLALEFAETSMSLKSKLVEVQQLSEEKQETLQKQNTELQAALLKGQTIERQRVALDLHDNLGSTLSALWLSVETIDQSKMNTEEMAIHQNLRENLEKAYNDVRLLSHNLLPEEFEKQGLVTTLQGFARKVSKSSGIRFELKIDKDFGRVDNRIEFELYSICLELVNNILKHSKASEAKIELLNTGEEIKLTISDNGIGTFENDSDGKGMKNVRARVESLNGTWNLEPKESRGTDSKIIIPV